MFSSFMLYIQLIVLHNDINKKCKVIYTTIHVGSQFALIYCTFCQKEWYSRCWKSFTKTPASCWTYDWNNTFLSFPLL